MSARSRRSRPLKPGVGLVPREAIPGMPDDLADAVYLLSEESRTEALANWDAIGEGGRELYRRYLNRALLRRSRRDRCELAAYQLVEPDREYHVDGSGGD
jgi:hypothetical protein